MTQRMRNLLIHWAQVVTAAAVITSVASAVLSTAIWIVFSVWGAYLLAAAGVATSAEMAGVKDKVDDLLRRVVVLARPDQIVHYRDLPVPLNGACVRGRPCAIVIFAERDLRALECQVIPDRTRLLVTQGNRTWEIPAVQRGAAVNLGPSPRALEPTFLLPQSLQVGEAQAEILSGYTGCLWQTDGEPPATQLSPQFKINVIGGTGTP